MTLASVYADIFSTLGSSALSTAHSLATSTTMRLISASCSRVSMPFSPRWSEATLITAPTSTWVTPMPARSSPPRAVSSTARSICGSHSTIRADTGPVMSPSTVRWPSM